jgi:hypothetical protein
MDMSKPIGNRALPTVGRLALALAIGTAAFLGIYRRLHLRWGATDAEVARAMPGDEVAMQPVFNATRAVTIDASPSQVWPWIVQIGYGRAGWYGLDWLDNGGVPSARRIIPELQGLAVGDKMPIFPASPPFAPDLYQTVAAVAPEHYLLTKGGDGTTWIWALYPAEDGAGETRTRLVWRMRSAPYAWGSPFIVAQLFTELVDYVAVSENMLGIKERAEGRITPAARPYVQAGLWLVVFIVYLSAEAGIVFWRDWRSASLLAAGAALVTIALALNRPPLWVDLAAAVAACGAWRWARGSGGERCRLPAFDAGADAGRLSGT